MDAVQLSAALVSYAPEAPASWDTMLATARAYDRAGVDRLVVSDHVVFGEQLDAYARPAFDRIHMMPKPVQPRGVPIWISGTVNARVVDRLCRFGLRWIPWGDDAADIGRGIAAMRDRIAAAGTSPDGLQVVANLRVRKTDAGEVDLEQT